MAMGMMAGQGARQGYSKMNDGYNEQPGINWGRVGAYAGGAALGYGVLRAGAMKLKKSGHLKNAWGAAGRITGLGREGGWKGFRDLGRMEPLKHTPTKVDTANARVKAQSTVKANRAARKARLAQQQNKFQQELRDFGVVPDTELLRANRPKVAPPKWTGRKPTKAAMAADSAWDHLGGAKAFFGAMDYAEPGVSGFKRAGVAGVRGAMALGAIGLGMKALSWANPFNNN